MDMYENEQEVSKNIYCSTFICCHNDHFGRALNILELNEFINKNKKQDFYKYDFVINPVSVNKKQ